MRRHSRRTRRTRRGGADPLEGAPLNYHLSGNWASRMSLGQGADYFKYHEGQHGGSDYQSNIQGAPLRAITNSTLPEPLRGPAHLQGIDQAFKDVAGLKDQAGGRRKRRSMRHSKRHGKRHSKRHSKRHHKSRRHSKHHRKTRRHSHRRIRGGSDYQANMSGAPFPSSGMLLNSPRAYAEAGLNPEWKTDIAFTDAKIRDTQ